MASASDGAVSPSRLALGRLGRPPWVGLLAWLVIMSWRPVAHSLAVLMHTGFHGAAFYLVSFLVGAAGVVLMWRGFAREETAATLMGFAAGSMIWTGWCEAAFNFFAETLRVAPLQHQGYTLLTPGLLMIEASAVLFLVMAIFLGANQDTQCRMFLWFHRNLRIWPAQRTTGYKRQLARVTAMEYLFVVWFFYIVNIAIFDPRLLGPSHPMTAVILAADLAWAIYLVWKLSQVRGVGAAFRYAIPAVGAAWILVETGAAMQIFKEVWVHPTEYPLLMTANGAVFLIFMAAFVSLPGQRATGDATA